MRVMLKLVLDIDPDTAWRVIRSPAGLLQVSAPLMGFSSLEPGGFPEIWPPGEHPVRAELFGVLPVGEQAIDISYPEPIGDARLVRDSGGGVAGVLTVVTHWRHTMSVAPAPDGRTLYRDRLEFAAGPLTLALWPMYWAFWQWRGYRMRLLASSW